MRALPPCFFLWLRRCRFPETLRSENEELKTQVQSLSTRDRVTEIAQQEGMAQNQDNVVTIANTGE